MKLFATERYQAGMRNAFYQRCQFHDQDPIVHARIWLRYSAKRMGVLKPTAESGAGLALGSSHQTWMLMCPQKKMWMRACPLRMRMQNEHLIKLIWYSVYECVMPGPLSHVP